MSTKKDMYGFVLAANIRIYFKILKQRVVFFIYVGQKRVVLFRLIFSGIDSNCYFDE